MLLTIAINTILLITLLLPSLPTAAEQSLDSKLARHVSGFDSEKTSVAGQLIEFAQQFDIPMGIEWVERAGESSAKPVHARNKTARAVLEQIIKQRQGMGFSASDGVVHVFDQSFINDSRNFLSVHIPHFRVENETLFGAEFWLKIDIERVLTPVAGGFAGGHGYGIPRTDRFDKGNINLSVNDATVRQLLDRIVSQQGNALWLVRILPTELMSNGRFYAQSASADNKTAAADFRWEFIPLKTDVLAHISSQ
jgi:hypothetical protein